MTDKELRTHVLIKASNLAVDFVVDNQEDLEKAIRDGLVTIDEIVDRFKNRMYQLFP